MFLHSRAAARDFAKILREEGFGEDGGKAVGGRGGVVHSYTGTVEEMKELVSFLRVFLESMKFVDVSEQHAMGFYFSVNGCSMKAAEQLEMIKEIPLDRLMLETGSCSFLPRYCKES